MKKIIAVLLAFLSMVAVVFDVTGAASTRFTKAAAGGVIICVVPGWLMNPPLAATNAVTVPGGS